MMSEIFGKPKCHFYPDFYYRRLVKEIGKYLELEVRTFSYDGKWIKIIFEIYSPKGKKGEKLYNYLSGNSIEVNHLENVLSKLGGIWGGRIVKIDHFEERWLRGKGIRKIWRIRDGEDVSGYIIILWKSRAMIASVYDVDYPGITISTAVSFPLNYWSFDELLQLLAPIVVIGGEAVLEKIDEIKEHNKLLGEVIEACYVLSGFKR